MSELDSTPQLVFVAGPNAAGKSSFIRTRINSLSGWEIVMTDVFKSRSKEITSNAIKSGKNIVLETVFNDSSFKDLIDQANNAGYDTSLIVLFLDTIQHSIDRVANRSLEQNGLIISLGNIRINFNESFKNIAEYYFYFDHSDFIYTGFTGRNRMIMSFDKSTLVEYYKNDLQYPQKFAGYGLINHRLSKENHDVISNNIDYSYTKLTGELNKKRRMRKGFGL